MSKNKLFLKRSTSGFILILALVSCVSTPETTTYAPALYKLESGATVMYFFGSIHVGTEDFYPLPEAIRSAYDSCDALVVELDALSVHPLEAFGLLQRYLMYQKGDQLDNHLKPVYREKLKALLEENSLPYAQFQIMKPGAVEMALTEMSMRDLAYKTEFGIDMWFLDNAHKEGKTILELESADLQMSLLGAIPDDVQMIMLERMIDDMERNDPSEIHELVASWKAGDMEAIAKAVAGDPDDPPELVQVRNTLDAGRNVGMAQRLAELIEEGGSYFVVIGAAHYTGEKSVIDLLKKEGYEIKRENY